LYFITILSSFCHFSRSVLCFPSFFFIIASPFLLPHFGLRFIEKFWPVLCKSPVRSLSDVHLICWGKSHSSTLCNYLGPSEFTVHYSRISSLTWNRRRW
jgi:hypothetical protein